MSRPLRTAPPPTEPEAKPVLLINKHAVSATGFMASILMTGFGAGYAWGWPLGLFVAGIMTFVFCVLLGIG